ncbi:ExbD/TolR family protein [Oceaniradius stylonematis]|uniref:ExbD/TolR family protein n=1 Tax=Oceaniradius stylonematis TaxID=2184161 RepID=UPI00273F427A|nr:biopolymer transporter ExbD [Oceaniradius stylonematis]
MRIEAGACGRARRISLTSLIDVIFLLLLFFMLTATFSRFADVELSTGGGASQLADQTPVFLQLHADGLSLNAEPLDVSQLGERLLVLREAGRADVVILSVRDGATSQQLVDVIAAVGASGGLPLQIVR